MIVATTEILSILANNCLPLAPFALLLTIQICKYQIAGMVAEEFWYQGDLEKSQLSSPLVPQFDREFRHELPRLQVGFCQGVCLPVYRALGQLSGDLRPLEQAVINNRDKWDDLAKQTVEKREDNNNKVTRNL